MSEQELVRDHLLKHARSPMNGRLPENANEEGELTNPICGDHVRISFHLADEQIKAAGFTAKACAICTASASLLCELVQGLSVSGAIESGKIFEEALLSPIDQLWPEKISHLSSFSHLKVNRQRRACALLPWIVLRGILLRTFKET